MSTDSRPGPRTSVLGILTGLGSLAIGVGLLRRSETAFGAVWSSLFVVLGLIVLLSYGLLLTKSAGSAHPAREVNCEGEPARFLPRHNRRTAAAMIILVLLGGWFLVMGVVGAIEENWLWPVLSALPVVYFLGFPVLAAVGRFRSGGVWLTPTRVVNEHFGLRTEIALADIATVMPRVNDVRIVPTDAAAVRHQRLTPRVWCARIRPGEIVITTDGITGGRDGLAAEVRDRAATAQGR